MTILQLAIASLSVGIGALIQGSIGFGLNVVAAPVLVLIDTTLVPGPALFAALALTILVGTRERGGIDAKGFGWLILGRLPATTAAAFTVAVLPERGLAIALAASVLVAVGLSLAGWKVRRTPATLVTVGALSGVMGTISSVGGPPVAMAYQDARGAQLRGTLSAILGFGATFSCVMLSIAGRFGTEEIRASLVLLPGIVVGFIASRWTAHLLDRGFVRPAVLGFSAASAIAAIVRYAI
ncbi:MAG: sulfite exporter TauE/SafE family protein [Actinomycetota bacterium]